MATSTIKRRKNYGLTAWGAIWVDALESFEDDRLGRGRSYANTGKVLKLDITNGKVTAKVAGSYRPFYQIKLELEQFTAAQKQMLKSIIEESPSLATELARGLLPTALLDLCQENKIPLLPDSWSDFKASCSCPDWGNPCKHQAATCYMLASEIDKDPLVLLQLRGFERKELELLEVEDAANPDLESFVAMFQVPQLQASQKQAAELDLPDPVPLVEKHTVNENYQQKNYEQIIEQIFYIPKQLKTLELLNLLSENPVFWNQGDFRSILKTQLIASLQRLAQALRLKEEEIDQNLKFHKISYKVNPEAEHYLDILNFASPKHNSRALLLQLAAHPLNDDLEHMEPSFRFYLVLMHFALKIVEKGLFYPELLRTVGESFCVRYKTKRSIFKDSLALIEAQFGESPVYELLNYFISFLVFEAAAQLPKANRIDQHKITKVFFTKDVFVAEVFAEQKTRASIANWLERLDLDAEGLAPVLRFEIVQDKFLLSLDVRTANAGLKPYYDCVAEYAAQSLLRTTVDNTTQSQSGSTLDSTTQFLGFAQLQRKLSVISEYIPELKKLMDTKVQQNYYVAIDLKEMSEILLQAKPVLDFLGVELVFPKELARLLKPQLQVKVQSASANPSLMEMQDLLNFSYEIALGDETINVKDFKELVSKARGLVKFRDQYVFIDPEQISKIFERIYKPLPVLGSSNEALFTLLSGEFAGVQIADDNDFKKLLDFIRKEEKVKIPKGLKATLRPYQERGFRWLYTNIKKKLGSCIADDMGLGKTIQVIALLLAMKSECANDKRSADVQTEQASSKRSPDVQSQSATGIHAPALVVCPTALIGNWSKECAKFAPSLKVEVYHGSSRKLPDTDFDLVLTSYGTFRRDHEKFAQRAWGLLIIDEAQNIKNTETKQAKALKSIKAKNYIAMTGTPVENRLSDLWSIMDFANRGYLGSLKTFAENFAKPIEAYQDPEVLQKLRLVTSPFILRRLKTDKSIINDLPEKIISDDYCSLTKEQAALYKAFTAEIMEAIESSEGIERKGLVFKLITALKQICNHPANFTKENKVTLEQSGKAMQLMELARNIFLTNEKILVFTQYKEMGEILVKLFADELNEEAVFFHGGLSRKERDAMVERFQEDLQTRVMIISLKAGGVGLNLTAANHVVHYDLWWNPAVENQATDRAFRIGQRKKVLVHRFISMGTFEEKIDAIIKSKQELADLSVSQGENWITKISNAELRDLLSLSK